MNARQLCAAGECDPAVVPPAEVGGEVAPVGEVGGAVSRGLRVHHTLGLPDIPAHSHSGNYHHHPPSSMLSPSVPHHPSPVMAPDVGAGGGVSTRDPALAAVDKGVDR